MMDFVKIEKGFVDIMPSPAPPGRPGCPGIPGSTGSPGRVANPAHPRQPSANKNVDCVKGVLTFGEKRVQIKKGSD